MTAPDSAMWETAKREAANMWDMKRNRTREWHHILEPLAIVRAHKGHSYIPRNLSSAVCLATAPRDAMWVTLLAFGTREELEQISATYNHVSTHRDLGDVLGIMAKIAERSGPQTGEEISAIGDWAAKRSDTLTQLTETRLHNRHLAHTDSCRLDPKRGCCVYHDAAETESAMAQSLRDSYDRKEFVILPGRLACGTEITVAEFVDTSTRYPLCIADTAPAEPDMYGTMTQGSNLNILSQGCTMWLGQI